MIWFYHRGNGSASGNAANGAERGANGRLRELKRALVGVDTHVIHQHLRREYGGRVGSAGPVSTDGQVQDDEFRAGVEGPGTGLRGRRKGLVDVARAVDVVLNLPLRPDHAVCVPGGGGKAGRAVGFAAVQAGSVDGRLHPVVSGRVPPAGAAERRIGSIDVLHDVEFAAGRPVDGGDVVAQQPEGGPHTLGLGQLHLCLDATVLEAEQALGLEPRGGVNGGRGAGLLRDDVQVAVGADIGTGTGRVAGAGGRSPGAIGLKLVVATAVGPEVVGPEGRVGLGVGGGGVGELVGPDEGAGGDVGRETLAGNAGSRVPGGGGDGLDGDAGGNQNRRLVLLRRGCGG